MPGYKLKTMKPKKKAKAIKTMKPKKRKLVKAKKRKSY